MTLPEAVNAYVAGDSLFLMRREGAALKRATVPADYSLYLARADVDADLEGALRGSKRVRSLKREGSWLRVGTVDARARDDLADDRNGYLAQKGIGTFEADVDPVARHLADASVRIQAPRRCYLDIETDSRVTFAAARKGDARVLSWAVTDDGCRATSMLLDEDKDSAEKRLLEQLWEHLQRYDQVVAWNGDGFDFPVVIARSDVLDVRFDPRRWLWLDHLLLFKRMNMHAAESGDEKQSMRLESIAMATLGEGKGDFDSAKTWEAWAAGGEERRRLLRYNEKDTDLLRRLEAKTGFAALFDTVCEACGVFAESRSLQPTVQMDGFMFRLGLQRGVHFPSRRYREAVEKYAGAYVMAPRAHGIERDVHVADFKSLYPSIILTWNMSPETKRPVPINGPIPEGCCRSPLTGEGFDANAPGILTEALRALIGLRDHWKTLKKSLSPGSAEWHDADRKSTAYKVVANSFYGVLGSTFSRFFDRAIAESITQNARWLIEKTIEAAEACGWKVIYADTDSLFVKGCTRTAFEEFVRGCNADLYPALLRTVGCAKNEILLDYEKAFERLVFVSAKHYAGWYAHVAGKPPKPPPPVGERYDPDRHSHPEVKGLEYKRGDTSLLGRRLQEEIIYMLMRGEERPEAFRAVVERRLAHVLNDPLPKEEVVISKALTKPLNQYKTTTAKGGAKSPPPHVQVAHMLKERGVELSEGARVEYFVADGSRSPQKVLPIADLGATEPDRYHLWEDLVYRPTMRLLQAALPETNWELGFASVRPAKPRRRDRVLPGQEALDLAEKATDARASVEPFGVFAHEAYGEEFLRELAALAQDHPGDRPMTVHLRMATGAVAVLGAKHRVDGSERLAHAAEALRFRYAAWVSLCHVD